MTSLPKGQKRKNQGKTAFFLRAFYISLLTFYFCLSPAVAQPPRIPPGEKEPVLRLEAGGPTSFVTALAFSPDGKTLYAAGYDKAVRLWNFDPKVGEAGTFVPDSFAYRVPINPGLDGAINAVALSADGTWLAVAGEGVIREGAGFRQPGLVLPVIGAMSAEMWADRGMIYVFNTKNRQDVITLRGHQGPVFALAFAPAPPGKAKGNDLPPLVSIARERDLETNTYHASVRLWDVAKGMQMERSFPANPERRPGLAVWRTGQQPNQLAVAFAWADQELHFWDIARDKVFKVGDGKQNNSVAYVPERGSVLTGSFHVRDGQLKEWDFAGGQEPQLNAQQGRVFPRDDEGYYSFPLAMTLFSSGGDGMLDHVAVVLRAVKGEKGEEAIDGLSVLSLRDFRIVNAWVPLWKGRRNQPVLAAAARGDYLAVAGNDEHVIALFSIRDLLNKKREPRQWLRSAGAAPKYVSFVSSGQALGLLLNEKEYKERGALPRQPGKGDYVFDFSTRQITPFKEGEWKLSTPALDGWQARRLSVKDAEGKVLHWAVSVHQGDSEKGRIELKPGQVITDYAILPPRPPLQIPILALAYIDEISLPALGLYNAATGEQLRQLTGHTAPIRCLAFAGDGRLLASVAEDQTISVWSLTTLGRSVGVRGLLKGLAVKGLPAVAQVDANSPYRAALQPEDIIEGIVEKDRLRPLYSLRSVIDTLAEVESGQTVVLRVRDPKGKPRDVELVIGRDLDERKRAVLLSVGAPNILALVDLAGASQVLSPLSGVTLSNTLLVGQVGPELFSREPAASKLQKGDVIEGLVVGKQLMRLTSPRSFYETVELMKPQSTATLRVRGKGDVALVVGQAIYEWKPLLSLFITRTGKPEEREWIGWSPFGQYESSAPKADRLIGWHFNTGDPQQPSRFATADQYRKDYYKEGILKHLVAQGSLSPALKAWEDENKRKPLPQPRMTLWIEEVAPDLKKVQGPVLLRQPKATLKAGVDDFPAERIDVLEWQFDDQPPRQFEPTSGAVHTADLAQMPWQRGEHRLRVRLRTQEIEPQEFVQELTLRYQPPPPAVKSKLAQRQEVNKPDFTLQATVQPALPGQAVQIRLNHRQNGKDVNAPIRQRELDIDHAFKLQPGENWIEVVAVNQDALAGYEEYETERVTWLVTYSPPAVKVPPPRISLNKVVLVPEGSKKALSLPIKPSLPVIVDVPKVQIAGQVEAMEKLTRLEWSWTVRGGVTAPPPPGKPFEFEPDKHQKYDIHQELTLQPGLQEIRFLAKTAHSEAAQSEAVLEYRPALPALVLAAPAKLVHYEGDDAAEFSLEGRLVPAADPRKYAAAVLVNGQELADLRPTIDEQAQKLTVKIPLQPGNNNIQVKLRNEWKVTSTSEAILVRYLRPPRITKFEGPRKSAEPLVNLVATVDSALPLKAVEADVNGREIAAVQMTPPDKAKKEKLWTLHLKDVPLDAGDNQVHLRVSNTEAPSRAPGNLTITYTPAEKAAPPPEIELLDPRSDSSVTDPEMSVRFRLKSASPLKRVELVREAGTPLRRSFDLSKLQPDALGYYEVKTSLRLESKANRIRIEVLNEGGVASTAVVVNYLQIPVLLDIDGIEVTGRDAPIQPQRLHDGKLSFPTLPGGWLVLKGHVTGSNKEDEQFQAVNWVRICVNGFQQMPVQLDPAVGNSRAFEARILLNRAANNQIEVSLPQLKQDTNNRREFTLACAKPQPIHRLHVLIVGVGEKDRKKLIERMLTALDAKRKGDTENEFTTPVFGEGQQVEGQLYGPLTEDVTPDQVITQLYIIKRTIDRLAKDGAVNDVVMVYYVGKESVTSEGHYFLTDRSEQDKVLQRSAVSCEGLVNHFTETLGAQLLYLDVTRTGGAQSFPPAEAKDRIAQWLYNPHLGVLRYAWRGAGDRPNDAWLLNDWRAAMSTKPPTLGKVVARVATLFSWEASESTYVSHKYSESLTYNPAVPTALADFGIGGQP